jgi:hypothetical protein
MPPVSCARPYTAERVLHQKHWEAERIPHRRFPLKTQCGWTEQLAQVGGLHCGTQKGFLALYYAFSFTYCQCRLVLSWQKIKPSHVSHLYAHAVRCHPLRSTRGGDSHERFRIRLLIAEQFINNDCAMNHLTPDACDSSLEEVK